MEWTKDHQLRHAALCAWPKHLNGRDAEILRVQDDLQLLGYTGCIESLRADDIVRFWKEAGWIIVSPNGAYIRLTPAGYEQWARWQQEDRLWRSGPNEEMKLPKRLVAGEPANNLRRIREVLSSHKIESIHDPYIDVKALENLLKLKELGVQIEDRLRLLGTSKENINLRTVGQFLRNDINTQNKSHWEMRTYTSKPSPHRRFLVCVDGSIVTCGPSLNSLNKDEALDLIPANDERAKHDRQFFDEKWKQGKPL